MCKRNATILNDILQYVDMNKRDGMIFFLKSKRCNYTIIIIIIIANIRLEENNNNKKYK